MFTGTVTEKLLIYALGRGLEPVDMPVVRNIVRSAASHCIPSSRRDTMHLVMASWRSFIETSFCRTARRSASARSLPVLTCRKNGAVYLAGSEVCMALRGARMTPVASGWEMERRTFCGLVTFPVSLARSIRKLVSFPCVVYTALLRSRVTQEARNDSAPQKHRELHRVFHYQQNRVTRPHCNRKS